MLIMSMLIELFGDVVLTETLEQVKERIRNLPEAQKERRSYLLHEWSVITGQKLSQEDFESVDAL